VNHDGAPPHEPSPFDEAFLRSLPRLAFAVSRLRAREGEGGPRADRRGGRVEFADRRAYAAGDDPRAVDWPAWSRTGRLFVKEYERRDELSFLILVDDSASMPFGGKLVAAQRLAYVLALLALCGGHRVRLGLCAAGALRRSAEVAGPKRMRDVRTSLESARGRGATRLSQSIQSAPGAARGSRVLVLLSDLWAHDDGRRALAVCARRGDEVDVLHLFAASDLAAPQDAVLVEDAETAERRALPAGAGDSAVRAAAQRETDWRGFAARLGLRYVPLDATQPTEGLVLTTLRAAGVLR
jgi:uncharacterized protein (DUF58 family)